MCSEPEIVHSHGVLDVATLVHRYLSVVGVMGVVLDANGVVTMANRTAAEVFGWPEGEVVGKDWFVHFVPEDMRAARRAEFDAIIRAPDEAVVPELAAAVEKPALTRSGEIRRVVWHAERIRDGRGYVAGFLALGRDVTEARKAETAFRETEAELHASERDLRRRIEFAAGVQRAGEELAACSTVEQVVKATVRCAVDHLGTRVAWVYGLDSKAVPRMLAFGGERPDEDPSSFECQSAVRATGRSMLVSDIGHNPPFGNCARQCVRFGIASCATFPIALPDGCVATLTGAWSGAGRGGPLAQTFSLLEVFSRTVSLVWQRCLAEEKLRKLSRAVEASPASIVITDAAGVIEYVNPKFCQSTGYSSSEVLGQNPRLLKSGAMPAEVYQVMWTTIQAGREWQGEFLNRKRDGQLYWESASISPVRDEQGAVTHFVAVKQDITELKRVHEELARAKEAAEAATRAKSAFLANMSHEIRTPMNAVRGLTELALRTDLTSQQRDYLEKIGSSAASLLGIIDDILDFSKIEAGRLTLEKIEFELEEVLSRVVAATAPQAHAKGLPVTLQIEPSVPPRVVGDPVRLGQILINLTGNAVKFTPAGQVVLSVKLLGHQDNQVMLRFGVADSGIGMSADQLGALFQPFSQGDESTTRKYGGTGLGLAISKHLVEVMGGDLAVESEPGRGSTFSFHVLLGRSGQRLQRARSPELEPEPVPSLAAQVALRGRRVLIAEDNDINAQIARELLEAEGMSVVVVRTGREAVAQAARGGFDVILMDIQMPEMDGLAAAREIRKLETDSGRVPIIAMTAHAMSGDREKSLEAGMNGHVTKPIDPLQLLATMSRWLQRATRPASPESSTVLGPERLPSSSEPIPEFPGIDTRSGLSRVAGNRRLYLELLQRFRHTRATAAQELERLLDSGDLEAARDLAHALKGVAANLGAVEVADAASRLDRALGAGEGEGELPSLLARLREQLERVMRGLAGVSAPVEPAVAVGEIGFETPPTGDLQVIAQLVGRLKSLLEACDLESRQCLADLRPLVGHGALGRALETAEGHLRTYDFASARRALEEASQNSS